MRISNTRREFMRKLGLGAAPCPSSSTCPAWRLPTNRGASSGWSSSSAPTASCRRRSGPTKKARRSRSRRASRRSRRSRTRRSSCTASATGSAATATTTCAASAACSPASSSLPATSRAAPTRPPAGRAASRSIRRSRTILQQDAATQTRFGSLEFGVLVPERADTWTRMVYAGAESADRADRRSVPDVQQAVRPDEATAKRSAASSTTCRTTSRKSAQRVSAEDRQLARRADHVRPRDWSWNCAAAPTPSRATPRRKLEPGVEERERQHARRSAACRSSSW